MEVQNNPSTLLIRHLPKQLPDNEKEELLKLFGAVQVKCMGTVGKFKHSAFARFTNGTDARYALSRLHQLEVLESRLVVEYAKKEDAQTVTLPPFKSITDESIKTAKKQVEDFKESDTLLTTPTYQYKYPPCTPEIITNIAHFLITKPQFYTQVLHIMNKMNLPAPFGPVVQYPHDIFPEHLSTPVPMEVADDTKSTSESELESENEDRQVVDVLPVLKQTTMKRKRKLGGKRIKLVQAKSKPGPVQDVADVFDETNFTSSAKTIQLNIVTSEIASSSTVDNVETSGFGTFDHLEDDQQKQVDSGDMGQVEEEMPSEFIATSKLRRNRISQRDMSALPVFRNYSCGDPSTRLYVKNLAKKVEQNDLKYIFGRYVNWKSEEEKNMFNIQLMTEGRMKGQAFVTLPSLEVTQTALEETNGFVLQGKPMVVQFARSAKPKDTVKQ